MTPSVLTVAGFDPSGGAGVQADLRVFASLGAAGLSVATALTVQDTRGVRAVHPVDAAVIDAQLDGLFADASIAAVKIGMLGGAAQARSVARALNLHKPMRVILDPVLASTGGFSLLDVPGREVLLHELLPLCDLVTPNLSEAAALTGLSVCDESSMTQAGEKLLRAGAKAVLIKGGHLSDAPTDVLFRPGKPPLAFAGARVATAHTHGTGCLLSSAIAAFLALGRDLEDSVREAKELVARALKTPVVAGSGRGYPGVASAHARRLGRLEGLYVLTDPSPLPGRDPETLVRAALAGGARVIQLRDKTLSTPDLVRLAIKLNGIAREHDALFIINDRVDVVLASDADGVHLGPDDMLPEDARRLLGADRLIGVSAGTVEEARRAAPHASYLGVGAIFATATKSDAGAPVGLGRLREIAAARPGVPLVAIGGIDESNIADALRAGAAAAAVVSAVSRAADMKEAAKRLADGFKANRLLTAPNA